MKPIRKIRRYQVKVMYKNRPPTKSQIDQWIYEGIHRESIKISCNPFRRKYWGWLLNLRVYTEGLL